MSDLVERLRKGIEANQDPKSWQVKYMNVLYGEIVAEIEKLRAERDAIRAKTIEECALEADRHGDPEIRDAIYALAQTDEGKTESGK